MQSNTVSSKFAGALAALALCTCPTGAIAATAQETSPDPMAPVVEPAPPTAVEVVPPPPAAPLAVQEVMPAPPVAPPAVRPISGGGGGIGVSPLLLGLGGLVAAGLLYFVLRGKKKNNDPEPTPTPTPTPTP